VEITKSVLLTDVFYKDCVKAVKSYTGRFLPLNCVRSFAGTWRGTATFPSQIVFYFQ